MLVVINIKINIIIFVTSSMSFSIFSWMIKNVVIMMFFPTVSIESVNAFYVQILNLYEISFRILFRTVPFYLISFNTQNPQSIIRFITRSWSTKLAATVTIGSTDRIARHPVHCCLSVAQLIWMQPLPYMQLHTPLNRCLETRLMVEGTSFHCSYSRTTPKKVLRSNFEIILRSSLISFEVELFIFKDVYYVKKSC